MSDIHDLIIVGGGPAGLSAGIYSSRAGYNSIIIEKLGFGGQMMLTDVIENYPGFEDGITGFELQDKMLKQAKKFGIETAFSTVNKIEKRDDYFEVLTNEKIYRSLSVILASGAKHKELNIPGEKEFASKGVSYCGTCDGPFFRNKDIAVIGGGDTALTEALFLSKFAKSVKIIHRRDRFRAVKDLIDKTDNTQNIEYIYNSVVTEIKGDDAVKSIILKNTNDNSESALPLDGVFIFVGILPNTGFLDQTILDNDNYIITDNNMNTKINGLFAAGDVRSNTFRQVICAASDGAVASEHAGSYIDELKGVSYK